MASIYTLTLSPSLDSATMTPQIYPEGKLRCSAPVFEPGGKVEKAWRTFYAEAAQGGVLLHPNHHWYVGMSHTEQDIDETLNVCETALWKVKEEL